MTNTPTTSTETPASPSASRMMRMLGIALILGAVTAIIASLFLSAVEYGQEFLYHWLPESLGLEKAPWWWAGLLLLVASGIVLLARKLPGGTGSGPLTGFHFDTPASAAPSILLAAFASLICGVALGPEAPLIVLGTTIGALVSRNRPAEIRKAIMFIGGAAAIGAVFGNPFITGFMILEFAAFGLVPATMLTPVFTALGSSYIVSLGFWGIKGFAVHPLSVPGLPTYEGIMPGDLLLAVGVSLVAGIVAILARRGGQLVDGLAQKRSALVLIGGAVVTTLVLFIGETVFGVNQNQILFSGNGGMPDLIAQTSIAAVIFILLGKGVAYAAALGSGFRGGPIFPATFLGVAVGVLASLLFPHVNVSALAAAGIAASAGAFLKLPATSALLGALLIAGAGAAIAPFAIFGAVIGFAVRILADAIAEKRTHKLA
jgi:H+/Cl- antiporter ClcA